MHATNERLALESLFAMHDWSAIFKRVNPIKYHSFAHSSPLIYNTGPYVVRISQWVVAAYVFSH